jgi:hypothetical protein
VIISVRGASGAGKSHLVRTVFAKYATGGSVLLEYPPNPRRRQLQYGAIHMRGDARLFVPGHYKIANGGVDTIGDLDMAYDLIAKHHAIGCDVLYEGMNMTDGPKRLVELKQRDGWDCRVVLLDTSFDECVASVRERGHSISEKSIRKVYDKSYRDYERFLRAGLRCGVFTRAAAEREVMRWLTETY